MNKLTGTGCGARLPGPSGRFGQGTANGGTDKTQKPAQQSKEETPKEP